MTAQTAMAPGIMRPLAPSAGSPSSSSKPSGGSRGYATQSSGRPLKPLLAANAARTPRSRPIALAPTTSIGKAAMASTSAAAVGSAAAAAAAGSTTAKTPASSSTPTPRLQTTSTPTSTSTADHSNNRMARCSSGGSASSSSATSRQLSTSPLDDDSSTLDAVQPKREWVLPARAKPGRKPSEVEPPTKRKAQNRASQRAFRERKQSYVSSLEEKIEEYEKRGVGVSLELQRVARRLKEENEALRKENGKLRERIQTAEATALNRDREEVSTTTSAMRRAGSNQSSSRRGVDAPMLVMDDASHAGAWSWSMESSGNRDGPTDGSDYSGSKTIAGMDRDCGFCTEESPCLCSGEAVLDLTGNDNDTPTAAMAVKQEEGEGEGGGGERRGSATANGSVEPAADDLMAQRRRSSQASLASTTSADGKRKLWYTVPSMGPPPAPAVQICPTTNERRATLPFRLGSQSNVLPPLQLTAGGKPKLWPIYSPIQHSYDQNSQQQQVGTVPVYRLRRGRGDSTSSAVCSGDPAHCNACSTDPALAAFCKAVADHLSPNATGPSTPAILDAGNAMPLRNSRKRSYSSTMTSMLHLPPPPTLSSSSYSAARLSAAPLGINLYTNNNGSGSSSDISASRRRPGIRTAHGCLTNGSHNHSSAEQDRAMQSIPEAWRRIKQHPSFPTWQGGLDMLADVVSRRSAPSSPSSSSPAGGGAPRVRIERRPSIAMKFHRKSNDRNADTTAAPPPSSPSPSSPVKAAEAGAAEAPAPDDTADEQKGKRRRLYVERESVEDALALLDRGFKAPNGRAQEQAEPDNCVCPLSRAM